MDEVVSEVTEFSSGSIVAKWGMVLLVICGMLYAVDVEPFGEGYSLPTILIADVKDDVLVDKLGDKFSRLLCWECRCSLLGSNRFTTDWICSFDGGGATIWLLPG